MLWLGTQLKPKPKTIIVATKNEVPTGDEISSEELRWSLFKLHTTQRNRASVNQGRELGPLLLLTESYYQSRIYLTSE